MAATTSTQPQPYHSQHQQQQSYTTPPNSQGHPQYSLINQQHYSPRAPHPQNASPNSPASPYYAHHQNQGQGQGQGQAQSLDFPYNLNLASARKDKQPQYIPAALRPTDRPLRSHPLTPPRSLHGSSDSLVDKKTRRTGSRPSSHRSNTTTTFDSSFPPAPTSSSSVGSTNNVRPASKSSDLLAHIPADSLRAALAPAALKDLPPITAPATRAHWKADANSPVCDFPICQKCFGIFERRHHCRRCGNVFCAEHSNERVPLDQNADFHPEGEKVRACEECAREWVEWVEARLRRMKDGTGAAEGKGGKKTTTGPMALMVAKGGGGGGGAGFGGGSDSQKVPAVVAGSVNGDWSTF